MAAIFAKDKKLLEAACFYAKLLGIENDDFTLDIDRRSIGEEDDFANGFCEYFRDEKHCEIVLEKCKKKREGESIYHVLAHEMVHAKQYIKGELEDKNTVVRWKGEYYPSLENDGGDFYWDSPWEIEAYGRAVGLYSRWMHYREGRYKL